MNRCAIAALFLCLLISLSVVSSQGAENVSVPADAPVLTTDLPLEMTEIFTDFPTEALVTTLTAGETQPPSPRPSACSSSPCMNGGQCVVVNETLLTFTCNCTDTNHTGSLCNETVPVVEPIPTSGIMTTENHPTTGVTPSTASPAPVSTNSPIPGTTTKAVTPSTPPAETACSSSPCKNSGMCTVEADGDPGYTCDCTDTGYTGLTCEEQVTACSSSPCKNTGMCTDAAGDPDYTCDCTDTGYTGLTCENKVTACSSSPCKNNGMCTDADGDPDYTCDCTDTGYTGLTCENKASTASSGTTQKPTGEGEPIPAHSYTGAIVAVFVALIIAAVVLVGFVLFRRRQLRLSYGRLDEDHDNDSGWSAFSKNPIYRGDKDYQLL